MIWAHARIVSTMIHRFEGKDLWNDVYFEFGAGMKYTWKHTVSVQPSSPGLYITFAPGLMRYMEERIFIYSPPSNTRDARPAPPRPAPRKNGLPRPAKSKPCPAPQKLTKPAGRSGAKLTVDSRLWLGSPFLLCPQIFPRGGQLEKLFIWLCVQLLTIFFTEIPFKSEWI